MSGYIGDLLLEWARWKFWGNRAHDLGVKISSAYNLEPVGGYREVYLPEARADVLKWDRIYMRKPCALQEIHRDIIAMHYIGPGRARDKAESLGLTVRQYNDRLAAAKAQADHLMQIPELA